MISVLNTSVTAITVDSGFGDILSFVLMGLGVVIGTLVLLAILTTIMGRMFIVVEAKKSASSKARPAAPAVNAPVAAQEDEELVAVLTAAAYETLGKPVRIIRFAPTETSWSAGSRTESHQSHNLR